MYCCFPAAQASKGNSHKIVYKTSSPSNSPSLLSKLIYVALKNDLRTQRRNRMASQVLNVALSKLHLNSSGPLRHWMVIVSSVIGRVLCYFCGSDLSTWKARRHADEMKTAA